MTLQDQIEQGSREIVTDGYPMSIGELLNLYREKELDLHPEFQRFFRWTKNQKSRLIESLLLGIPLPSIFVFQRKDGVWDVIDGLQRLSTIFEFVGILRDEQGQTLPMLSLMKTRYLPALANKIWEDKEHPDNALTNGQRLIIKRAKLDVKIIKSDSSETSKYELFQRLNTGGTIASDQEVRNCLLIMNNKAMFEWSEQLAKNQDFVTCTNMTANQLVERYDLELVLRFLVLKDLPEDQLKFDDMGEFLTDQMLALARNGQFDFDYQRAAFEKTFGLLRDSLAEDAFKKYDHQKQKFLGPFTLSAFEVVAMGIGYHFSQNQNWQPPADLVDRIKGIWRNDNFLNYAGSGVRASTRIPRIVPLGRRLFS